MYKRIDFSKLDGLPVYQDTLDFLQTSYREAISAVAKAFGSKVIVTGLTDQGTSYSDGWVIIEGELMPCTGGLKTTRILVDDTFDTELFNDGSSQPVYYTKRAKLGIAGGYALTDFIRVDTISALSVGLKNLTTAHNSLQAIFNTHTHSWNQVTDKPATFTPSAHRHNWSEIDGKPSSLVTALYRGSYSIGDITPTDMIRTVTFTNVGTTNYFVVGSLLSTVADWNQDNGVLWTIRSKNTTYFQLLLHELGPATQNLNFDYALISF